MKKLVIQIFAMFCCFVGYGQSLNFDFFTSGPNSSLLPIDSQDNFPYEQSGKEFIVRIQSQYLSTFTVDIGNLNVHTENGNGWSGSGTTRTYTTEQPSAQQIVNLRVSFKNHTTCNNQRFTISVLNFSSKIVKAKANNFNPKIELTKEFPSSEIIPSGQNVLYKIVVGNGPFSQNSTSSGSYSLEFEEITVSHSSCVTAKSLITQGQGYTITESNSNGFKIIRTDQNFRINYHRQIIIEFELTYHCSPITSTNCNSDEIMVISAGVNPNINGFNLSNNSCNDNFDVAISSIPNVPGKLDCECENCVETNPPTIIVTNNLPNSLALVKNCWKNCLALFTIDIDVNRLPNSNQNSIVFDVPIQAMITNINNPNYFNFSHLPISIEYLNSNNQIVTSVAGNEDSIRYIKFNLANHNTQHISIDLTWNPDYSNSFNNISFQASIFNTNIFNTFNYPYVELCSAKDDLTLYKSRVPFSNNTVFFPDTEIEYYLNTVNNNNNEDYFITSIEDILSDKLTYLGDLEYYYGNSSNGTYLPLDSGTIINGSIATVTEIPSNLNNNMLHISFSNNGLPIPISCVSTPKTFLAIRFKVRINQNVFDGDNIDNVYNVKYLKNSSSNEISDTSNNVRVTVGRKELLLPELFSKCPSNDLWLQTKEGGETEFINVKEGDEIQFRYRLRNLGTVNAFVYSILNSKPGIGDSHVALENGNLVPRDSDFNIDYKCDEIIVHTNSLSNNEYQIDFSNSAYNVGRGDDIYESHNLSNNINFTVDNSCTEDSNWLRVKYFENEYFILGPGEFLDVYYTAIIGSGSENQTAYNSFSYKVKSFNDFFNSNNSNTIALKYNEASTCNPYNCIDCTSFDLVHDTKYLISGWVKEEYPEKPHHQFKTFNQSTISVLFKDIQAVLLPDSEITFYPSGAIIDGWQRIIGEFTVPSDAEFIEINLNNISKVDPRDSYFDDVRILPSKANMKSFVYDQKTQKLMAELDENNYSTFYEYDQEGGLIRIKKETEKGVYTIQETRSSNVKKTDK